MPQPSPVRELRLVVTAADRDAAIAARVIAAPVETPWRSLSARLDAPAGLQLTLLQEPGPA